MITIVSWNQVRLMSGNSLLSLVRMKRKAIVRKKTQEHSGLKNIGVYFSLIQQSTVNRWVRLFHKGSQEAGTIPRALGLLPKLACRHFWVPERSMWDVSFFFDHTTWHVESSSPWPGIEPLSWKLGVSATGLPGKSARGCILSDTHHFCSFFQWWEFNPLEARGIG